MKRRAITPLQLALGLSLLVHAALLTVRVVAPDSFNRILREAPLDVILVNVQTPADAPPPDKPQALAQSTLAGGGDLEQGLATSPLPPSAFTVAGDSAEEMTRQVEALQAQQKLLLAQRRAQLAALAAPDANPTGQSSQDKAQQEQRRQLLEQLAQIERRVNEENARPRRRFVTPATRQVTYAVYRDRLRRMIEVRGTEHFPEAYGKKLYGELTMLVNVNADGSLAAAEVMKGSGNRELDRRAQAIVTSIGNFGRFTEAMKAEADQLLLPLHMKFSHEGTLETTTASAAGSSPGAPAPASVPAKPPAP